MQDFKNFDPQRLELLEARIMGNRHTPIVISDDEQEHHQQQQQPQYQQMQHHSNDSVESGGKNSHEEQPELKVSCRQLAR